MLGATERAKHLRVEHRCRVEALPVNGDARGDGVSGRRTSDHDSTHAEPPVICGGLIALECEFDLTFV